MAERPRRTARKPARFLQDDHVPSSSKRKAKEIADDDADLDKLLKAPKSKLTSMNLPVRRYQQTPLLLLVNVRNEQDIINASSWEMLSFESRARLAKLLPPTAFADYQTTLDPNHPSRAHKDASDFNSMAMEPSQSSSSSRLADLVLPSLFTDPHFLAASRTFQDHLYSGWLKDDFKIKVSKYEEGIRDGTLAAPWKDEEWEKDHPPPKDEAPTFSPPKSRKNARAGTVDLKSVVRAGDIISYRHNFSALDILVEKDVLVHSINTDRSITVLVESGTAQHLPPYLVMPGPPDPVPPIQSMDVSSPGMLETGILDLDGRVERTKRPNGNAWKSFTVYRWRQTVLPDDNKGGREQTGTLHYLRSTIHDA
ncbi:hypothetical protein GYMLUDRAFT_219227 [Collybiopsis luxurians FD-317 M1]|nr:hypothetical protein GYMLUDRAFT_219227 [Collybiopsis luxurians FD-317 M1]